MELMTGSKNNLFYSIRADHLPIIYAGLLGLGGFLLFIFTDFPLITTLFVNFLFCIFCTKIFKGSLSYLFLINPLVIWLLSLFPDFFINAGDGPDYIKITRSQLSFYTGNSNVDLINNIINLDFRSFYFGVVPSILIPDLLWINPDGNMYYVWQSTFQVILVSLNLLLAKKWKVMPEKYLLYLGLFSIISPSFFELGMTITRHFITFNSVLLFYICFIATNKDYSLSKTFFLLLSIFGILISKISYIIPIIAFILYYYTYESKNISLLKRATIIAILVIFSFLIFDYFIKLNSEYNEISLSDGNTFSGWGEIPIISIIGKYIYAIFGAFPFQKASYHIEALYSNNWLMFIMHFLSVITGLYFLCKLIFYGKSLLNYSADLRMLLIYGIILSMTIIRAQVSTSAYLIIFYPFFAPIFSIKKFRIYWFVPVLILLFFELAYTIFQI